MAPRTISPGHEVRENAQRGTMVRATSGGQQQGRAQQRLRLVGMCSAYGYSLVPSGKLTVCY